MYASMACVTVRPVRRPGMLTLVTAVGQAVLRLSTCTYRFASVAEELSEVSTTWTGCETIEDVHLNHFGSAAELLMVLSISDRDRFYALHMVISSVHKEAWPLTELNMINTHLGREFK